ncbi:MAG: rod shape-determining protein MreC, partial [Acidobacteria bacterium]|nr:rod shape-determining protein MreC [Acidobacteriota bacterium]
MEFLLHRFRTITILVMVIVAQLLLLAYQVRSSQDVRLIRVWAVTAVTPLARLLEGLRSSTFGFLRDYVMLMDARQDNVKLRAELDRFKMENQYLKNELSTAERVQALSAFQARTQSRTLAARIIGTGTGTNSKIVFVDRGSVSGVLKGMAVVTADGIVGKVIASYPTASQVMLVNDPNFAAGVISQKNRVHGTLKGQGHSTCLVDYVQNEEKVEVGEVFYTSGDDRIFPKGLPAGVASVVRAGKNFNKEIFLTPSGFQRGLEEVLIVLEGVHQAIPDAQAAQSPGVYMLPAPPAEAAAAEPSQAGRRSPTLATDADRLRERYRRVGDAQGHVY